MHTRWYSTLFQQAKLLNVDPKYSEITDTLVIFLTQQSRVDIPGGDGVGLFLLLFVFLELGISATFSM